MLDNLDQVTPAVGLRTPDFSKTIPEGRRELQRGKTLKVSFNLLYVIFIK